MTFPRTHGITTGSSRWVSILMLAFLATLFPDSSPAQPAYLLQDINLAHPPVSYNLQDFTAVGNTLYFTADDGVHGRELWNSDGTKNGTVLVKDINPGPTRSLIDSLTSVHGALFFREHSETWISDGTPEGTLCLKDLLELPGDLRPGIPVELDGSLFFAAGSSANGWELWRSDGTRGGTELVKHIQLHQEFLRAVNVNENLYLLADDGINGAELWASDDTQEGTALVKDINSGPASSWPTWLMASSRKLFFTADDGTHGREPWISDGTPDGTFLLKDIAPGPSSPWADINAWMRRFLVANSRFYFEALEPECLCLWTSDGTPKGTVRLCDFLDMPELCSTSDSTVVGDRLYFRTPEDGESWTTDGTREGTVRLCDFLGQPAVCHSQVLTGVGDRYFFFDFDGVALWTSDGTATGTRRLRGIPYPDKFAAVGNRLIFSAAYGRELWVSDGTSTGTAMITDFPGQTLGSQPYNFVQLGGRAFFLADVGGGETELWSSDGTPDGTWPVEALGLDAQNYYGYSLSAFRGKLGLFHPEGQLSVTEGSADDILLIELAHFLPLYRRPVSELNGKLYFPADDGVNGAGLWVTDGTPEGTAIVKEFRSDYLNYLVNAAGRLYFVGDDGIKPGWQIWASDGTRDGTIPFCDLIGMPAGCFAGFPTALDGRLFFQRLDPERGAELWTTDLTPAGIRLVKSFGPESTGLLHLTNVGGRLEFVVRLGTRGEGWASDGTPEGTVPDSLIGWDDTGDCGQLPPGNVLNCWVPPLVVNGKRYFPAGDATHGEEPWVSDGTPEGTMMLQDMNPGSDGSYPSDFIAVGGTLFFSADDGTHGREPWAMPIPGYRTPFHRGDPNSSGTTDISDGISIFGFLFLGDPPALSCKESADANNDGTIDISDSIYLLSWLFTGGPEPAAPGPTGAPCGLDPDTPGSPGDLGCEAYPACQ